MLYRARALLRLIPQLALICWVHAARLLACVLRPWWLTLSDGVARSGRRAARALWRLPSPAPRPGLLAGGDELTVARDVVFECGGGGGTALHATLHSPASAAANAVLPVIVVRTAYDRRNLAGLGCTFAEQGFRVLACDARGRFDSGGEFFPVAHELEDGGATLDWIAAQPWGRGAAVGAYGISYLGLTAWAAAGARRPQLKAVVPVVASSSIHPVIYGRASGSSGQGGALNLELGLRWIYMVVGLQGRRPRRAGAAEFVYRSFVHAPALDGALASDGPLLECDRLVANGEAVPFFRQVRTSVFLSYFYSLTTDALLVAALASLLAVPFFRQCVAAPDAADPFWAGKNELAPLEGAGAVAVEAHIIGGWYDFFVEEQLRDWRALRDARAARGEPPPLLTVGPWAHWSVLDFAPVAARAALDHFDRVRRRAGARRGARGAGDARGGARARVGHGRRALRPLRRVAAAARLARRPVAAAPRQPRPAPGGARRGAR